MDARRSNLIDMAADSTITRDDLRAKLASTDEEREAVERELRAINGDEALAREIEVLRDMLIEGTRTGYWQHIRTPQQRHDLYRRIGLIVEVDGDGNVALSGSLLPGEAFVGKDSRQSRATPPASRPNGEPRS